MSNTRNTGFLTNVVKYTDKGDISFVSGSTTLMSISSSGAVTVTGVISGSNALTSSYSQNSELLDNLDSTSFVFTSSFNTYSSSMSTRVTNNESTGSTLTSASASLNTASGSFSTRVTRIEGNYATTGSNVFLGAQTVCANITSTGTIIAQTLNVQQVTSSIVYSSGSNIFGCSLANTQQFTGSVTMTGSLNVAGNTCVVSICSPAHVGGTFSGTTIYGSTAICSDKGYFTGISLGATPISATTNATQIRFTNSGGDLYVGQEGSVAGGFYPGACAYDNVIYTNCPVNIILGGTSRIKMFNSGITCFQNTVCVPNIISTGASGGRYATFNAPTNGGYITFEAGGTAFGDLGSYCAQYGTGDATTLLLGSRTGYALALGTNSAERIRITTAGRVGIGNQAPVSALVVSTASDTTSLGQSGIVIEGSTTLTAGCVMALAFTAIPGTSRARAAVGSVVGSDWGKGNLAFYTRDASDSTSLGTADERMRITSAGRVGIGTCNPTEYKLQVEGTDSYTGIKIRNNNTACGVWGILDIRNNCNDGLQIGSVGNAGYSTSTNFYNATYIESYNQRLNLRTYNDFGITIGTNSSVRMCILNTGIATFACQMCTAGILNTSFRISNAIVNGTWQEWVAQGITLTNNSAIALFCINSQYDNLIVDLAAWIDQGAWSPVSYRFNFGYNVGTSYVAGLGAFSAICGLSGGTTYNETWCWKNCSGSNINNSAISLRIFGKATNEQISTGGKDLIVSSYLTRVS